jgi:hypothetical protein
MTLGSHQSYVGRSQVYATPRWILDALGPFDFDPCAMTPPRPWDCAKINITKTQDGLTWPWPAGKRPFVNPPFDQRVVGAFVAMLAAHGVGTLLTHARIETAWFTSIWQKASGILFLSRRIHFHLPDGTRCPHNSGAPALLASFGAYDLKRLRASGIAGTFVTSWETVGATAFISEAARNEAALPWEKWDGHPGMFHASLPGGGSYYTWLGHDGAVCATYSPPRPPYVRTPRPRLLLPGHKPLNLGRAETAAEAQALCEQHASRAGRVS